MLQQNRNVNAGTFYFLFCFSPDLLLTGDSGDLREGELQQDLLLVVHHIDSGPVDGNDDVVLGQIWTWKYNSSYYTGLLQLGGRML